MKTMDRVLLLMGIVLLCYTIADLIIFWHTGAEPTTLTDNIFRAALGEGGFLAIIKVSKDRNTRKTAVAEMEQKSSEEPPHSEGRGAGREIDDKEVL